MLSGDSVEKAWKTRGAATDRHQAQVLRDLKGQLIVNDVADAAHRADDFAVRFGANL
jgi:hypothetical protein